MRNVVLVTYDSLRADHCGHLGYHRGTTPTLDAMAHDGITFENAIAPASRTNPSMAGIFTGEPMIVRDRVANPEHARTHLRRHGTVAERFSENGYSTGAFCPNAYASRYYGFDRGFDRFEDFLFDSDTYQTVFQKALGDSSVFTTLRNVRNFVRREEAFRTWDTYIDQVEQWVHEQAEPFFLWIFSLDTHFPYLTPRAHREWGSLYDNYYYNWYCNQLIDELDINISDQTRRKIIDIYDDSIRFGDVLLSELQNRLAEFDPIFIIFGDHGEAFDERGVYGHFYPALYEEHVHVPLVISGTDVSDRIKDPATLLDIPQLLETVATSETFDPEQWSHEWVFATDYNGRTDRNLGAVRMRRWKYLRTVEKGRTRNRLYDLQTDPGERNDLTGSEHSVEEPLQHLMDNWCAHESEVLRIRKAVENRISNRPDRTTPILGPT